jgi:hypothetical protein
VSDPLCNGLLKLSIGFPGTGHEVAQKREKPNEKVEEDFAPHFVQECVSHPKSPDEKKPSRY